MKLVLTNKGDNAEIIVDSDKILLMEVANDKSGVGTHIVMHPNMGRNVNESLASIAAVIGVVAVMPAPANVSVMSLAKKN